MDARGCRWRVRLLRDLPWGARKLIAGFAVVALIVASFFAGRLGQLVSMPVATATGFAPAVIDLGARAWGQVIPIELTFVNRGSEPLTVREVKSSCGCTVVSEGLPPGHVIEAGGSRRIAAKLDTQLNPGPKQRTISLVAEGGRTYAAAISVQVIGAWSVSTDAVDFGQVVIDAPSEVAALERDIEFASGEFDLLSVASSAGWLECALGERIGDRRSILLRVQPTALRRGANSCVVALVTNCDVKPNATVFVRVRAAHALVSSPDACC